ncbi:MAG: hypothetical protein K9G69_05690 [Candidatus Nanopelagicales bacterium]|nr:hypothetical protein [Candidatus Nanopelagicales bacterium]
MSTESPVSTAPPIRLLVTPAILGLLAIALLWLVPAVGLFVALAAFALLPPWGRTYTERAVISIIVLLGVIAIAFPRNSGVPIDPTTARLTFSAFIVLAVALRLIPKLRSVEFPRVRVADSLILVLFIGSAFWLTRAYWGADPSQILSGLFLSGWDNHGHFTPFANTYVSQQTAWTTLDGSTAWNQWYPSLHGTTWALAEMAADGAGLSRIGLLAPYVQWSALSFAAAMATIVWVASDLTERVSRTGKAAAVVVAILITGTFTVLGSPAYLFNSGFTNFAMGVALVLAASYLSTRSVRSSVTLGWFILPLAIIASIGLWTPLVLGLVPAGFVVLWRLWKYSRLYAVVWLLINAAAGVVLVLTQAQAILGAEEGASASEFNQAIGTVGVGMTPFNVGLALMSPLLAALFIAIMVQRTKGTISVGFAGPIGAGVVLAAVFAAGAVAGGTHILTSYYVLKILDGMLLWIVPVLAAGIAIGVVAALGHLTGAVKVLAALMSAAVLLVAFGYVGPVPAHRMPTFAAAPGVEAGFVRVNAVENELVGEGIISTANTAIDTGTSERFTSLQWDGSGLLVNLWLGSLTGTLSVDQRDFYGGMPLFPFDASMIDYISFSQNVNPDLDVAVYWFRPSSGEFLDSVSRAFDPQRFTTVKVVIPPSALCPECEPA